MSGVRKMPSRLENEASKMAPGTLPLAMAVMATLEEMVDGSAQRYRKPSRRSAGRKPPTNGFRMSQRRGKAA